ncbi:MULTISPECIES: pitrilysin family protein [unclassified Pseudomonas]|uniref:M16 family metallopeptidase n=1 Tax=unclassified Pseudomonas TaxID=196821 RepID=UPI000BD4BFD1|nr:MULTISPECIES: pitrilysin family protein [unclassified Pseudomonas]PVZ10630.1 putative Zn-dependent peptidase [Pseudomonas sp. URIL14HWK12:I12]PVZ22056.1 putative Zn-dependent peptidase [Pseudomonas sp. URIL14HWK12:I10]PVZ30861.1 putative Zn-dependent peptidase [Pseudomonas sp. URIL14HWK12:I11]SNZ17178.1 Predicted Zn-dependent peptidase [Pseudomonas sp. URIL14HWK12:I9]
MRCLLLILLLCLPLPSFAADRLQVEGYLLDNGLQVLLKPSTEKGHVAIRLVVGVGFDDFPCATQKLPHLLEHLLFSGLDDSGEAGLEQRMQALGGEWNAFTSDVDTTFVIEAPSRNQRKVLDLLLAIITRTEMTQARLEAARKIVEHEDGGHASHVQRWVDRQGLGREASDQLAVEMGLRCADRASPTGLTLAQVNQVRQQWYAPNNMTLIVVGELDKLLPAYLERTYGDLPASEPGEHPAATLEGHAAQRERTLYAGWVGDAATLHWYFLEPDLPDDVPAATWDVLQDYLDWELYNQMRLQRGLSYGPWSANEGFGDQGVMSLNAGVDRADVPAARQAMSDMFQGLRTHGLDRPTFERIKLASLSRQAWAVQGNSALADYYWQSLADYEDGHFSDPQKALRAVTFEQANDALRRLLADPGYVRVEQRLITYDQLQYALDYGPWALAALFILMIGAVWLLRRRR